MNDEKIILSSAEARQIPGVLNMTHEDILTTCKRLSIDPHATDKTAAIALLRSDPEFSLSAPAPEDTYRVPGVGLFTRETCWATA